LRKLTFAAALALAVAGILGVAAQSAYAFPSRTTQCSSCHDGANVAVTATLASTAGTTATYNVSAAGADAIAVFDGATKVATITGTTGQFSVATGKTYTVFAVAGPGTSDGIGSTTVSPVAATPVDATAPVTTSNAVATYLANAAITLSATDVGSGVAHTYYRLDGGTQVEGTAIAVSAVGAHTLEFWSVDVAGNVETHKTANFVVTAPAPVDTAAPVTVSNAVANYVSMAAITLSATDAGSGVAHTYYRLDGAAQVEGKAIAVSALGAHTLEFWSVDVAGNVETHKTATFTVTAPAPVDVTAPVTTSNAAATYVSNAAITLSATDAGSGVAHTYYRLDGAAQVEGKAIAVSALGAHTLEFWSVDVAGNVETHKTATFTVTAPAPVDVTAPVTTSNAAATYVSNAAITLSATDAGSGVAHTYYRLDGAAQVEGKAIAVSALGAHTLEFWSVDVAGNVETHKTATFTVTAPDSSVTSSLTIGADKLTARKGSRVRLSGLLTPASGDERISIYVMRPGSTEWRLISVREADIEDLRDGDDDDHSIADAVTSGSASAEWNYRYKLKARGTYQFQARFTGDSNSAPVLSEIVSVRVR